MLCSCIWVWVSTYCDLLRFILKGTVCVCVCATALSDWIHAAPLWLPIKHEPGRLLPAAATLCLVMRWFRVQRIKNDCCGLFDQNSENKQCEQILFSWKAVRSCNFANVGLCFLFATQTVFTLGWELKMNPQVGDVYYITVYLAALQTERTVQALCQFMITLHT